MKYIMNAKNFIFECEPEIFEKDTALPTNTILSVHVESDGFGGQTAMDIDIKEFAEFAADLKSLYDLLKGTARLTEPYSENRIEFSCKRNGNITVKGLLNSHCRNGFEQELCFENEFDQTYIKNFAEVLFRDFEKYRQ